MPKPRKKKLKKIFRFEFMWFKDQRYEEVVKETWEEGLVTTFECVLNCCLDKCRSKLDAWNKTEFGHVGRKISSLQDQLERIKL